MEALLATIIVLGLIAGSILLNALVLTILWGWFMVHFGLPPISIAMAVGLGTIVSLVSNPCNQKEEHPFLTHLLKLGLMLLIGWIAHQCM